MKQTTLQQATAPLSSPGLHTGHVTTVVLRPAAANTGIVIRRIDMNPAPEISVTANWVGDTSRNTTLEKEGVTVATVEHLLSALHALQVDNVYIDIDGDEVPILNGSAIYWVKAIQQAGIVEQEAEREYLSVTEPVYMQGCYEGVEYIALPCDEFRVTAIIDFKSQVIGKQVAEYRSSRDNYEEELASCRTFVFMHEIMPLLEAGLIKGGALENAIVFVDPPLTEEQIERVTSLFNLPREQYRVENGVLTINPYRYHNEPARHKLLDFIGDIRLVGKPVKGHFIIRCPGHKNNAAFAQLLRKQLMNE